MNVSGSQEDERIGTAEFEAELTERLRQRVEDEARAAAERVRREALAD
jgi:hypothetical protein